MSSTSAVPAISSLVLQFCPEFLDEQTAAATATAAAPVQAPTQQQVLQVVKTVFNRATIVTRLYLDSFEKREKGFVQKSVQDLTSIRKAFYQYDAFLLTRLPKKTFKYHRLMQTKQYNHPANTQAMILEGCRGLDPSKAVIVVCGAQFYTTAAGKTSFVEPLPEMLKYCAQLILVDQDEGTLALLKEKLNSKKVVTVPHDLSKGMMRDWMEYASRLAAEKLEPKGVVERMKQFCVGATEKMKTLPLQILPSGKVVDYAVSSLVGAEIGYHLMREMLNFFSLTLGFKEATEAWYPQYPDFIEVLEKLSIDFMLLHARDIKGMAKRVYYADHVDNIVRDKDNPDVIVRSFKNAIQLQPMEALWEAFKTDGVVRTWHWVRSDCIALAIKACLIVPNEKQDGKVNTPSKKK